MSPPVEILREVRELLSEEKRWTQDDWARDAEGDARDADNPDACCWCLGGAFWRVTGDAGIRTSEQPWESDVLKAWRLVEEAGRAKTIFELNDNRTHAEVLETLDKAIAVAAAFDETESA